MTAALTPALALDLLRQLSADLRAAIVLDAEGRRLAGPDALAAPAEALLTAGRSSAGRSSAGRSSAGRSSAARSSGMPGRVEARAARGRALGAWDAAHGVVVVTGPLALEGLTLHDLTVVLAALAGGAADAPNPVADAPNPAADAPNPAAGAPNPAADAPDAPAPHSAANGAAAARLGPVIHAPATLAEALLDACR